MKLVIVLINARKWSNIIILTVNVPTISFLTLQEFVCRFVDYSLITQIPLNVHVRKAIHLVSMVNVYPYVIRSNKKIEMNAHVNMVIILMKLISVCLTVT